jgi:hypothetical protein
MTGKIEIRSYAKTAFATTILAVFFRKIHVEQTWSLTRVP